jgi:hypothetical protein
MKRRWPRSVRGAVRRGWTVITPDYDPTRDGNPSYLGLQIWTDRNANGHWVSSFSPTKFAFELEKDAVWFALRWS